MANLSGRLIGDPSQEICRELKNPQSEWRDYRNSGKEVNSWKVLAGYKGHQNGKNKGRGRRWVISAETPASPTNGEVAPVYW
jgi:hypothetical protein